MYLFISRFGFKSGICLLIAPVPVHCFSITLIALVIHSFAVNYVYHHNKMSVSFIPPRTPPLYSETGVYKGIHFFFFLLFNIDCGYSLEPPH